MKTHKFIPQQDSSTYCEICTKMFTNPIHDKDGIAGRVNEWIGKSDPVTQKQIDALIWALAMDQELAYDFSQKVAVEKRLLEIERKENSQ